MPLPIAMYSNSFVGEPKNGVPSGFGTCGETRTSHAARYFGPSSCGTRPVNVVEPRAGIFRAKLHIRARDCLGAVPRSECADEADDRIAAQSVLRSHVRTVDSR